MRFMACLVVFVLFLSPSTDNCVMQMKYVTLSGSFILSLTSLSHNQLGGWGVCFLQMSVSEINIPLFLAFSVF